MADFEKFSAKVWKQGNSLIITIPSEVALYGGYEQGDILKVMSKKEIKK